MKNVQNKLRQGKCSTKTTTKTKQSKNLKTNQTTLLALCLWCRWWKGSLTLLLLQYWIRCVLRSNIRSLQVSRIVQYKDQLHTYYAAAHISQLKLEQVSFRTNFPLKDIEPYSSTNRRHQLDKHSPNTHTEILSKHFEDEAGPPPFGEGGA